MMNMRESLATKLPIDPRTLGCKKCILIGENRVRVKWVYPPNDTERDWSDVHGNVGIFLDGYANKIEPPRPSDVQDDFPEPTEWIASDRFEKTIRWDHYKKALNPEKESGLPFDMNAETVAMVGGMIVVLVVVLSAI